MHTNTLNNPAQYKVVVFCCCRFEKHKENEYSCATMRSKANADAKADVAPN